MECRLSHARQLSRRRIQGLVRQVLAETLEGRTLLSSSTIDPYRLAPPNGATGADLASSRVPQHVMALAALRADPSLAPIEWRGQFAFQKKGQWLAQFDNVSGNPARQLRSIRDALAGTPIELTVAKHLNRDGLVLLDAPQEVTYPAMMQALSGVSNLRFVEPNVVTMQMATPDDSRFNQLYAMNNTGQFIEHYGNGTADADIDAPEAWDITTGSTSVIVATVDSGIDYTHPDLYLNIWLNALEVPYPVGEGGLRDADQDGLLTFRDLNVKDGSGNWVNGDFVSDLNGNAYIDAGDILQPISAGGWSDGVDTDGDGHVDDLIGWDFFNNDNDPFDDHGHGTHTAGTIGAMGNNGTGVVGLNWNVRLMPLKTLGRDNWGTYSEAISAIEYAVDHDVRVSNHSWGGGIYDQALYDVIRDAGAHNHLLVAAAGNAGANTDYAWNANYPSSFDLDNIISVAATTKDDQKAQWSDFGPVSVDLAAPGEAILSTVPQWLADAGGYEYRFGTSMATPHVTGAAALGWSLKPSATYGEIRRAILDGVDVLPALDKIVATGGRLNVHRTLRNLSMRVISSSPAENAILATAPVSFVLHFSDAYDPATVQANDLTINGVPAESVDFTDALTLTFSYSSGSPIVSEGPQLLVLGEGSIHRLGSGVGNPGYQSTFFWDSNRMRVASMSPADGATLTLPLTSITLELSEGVDPASVGIDDLAVSQGAVTAASVSDNLVTYTLSGLAREGDLSIALPAGAWQDAWGNPSEAFAARLNLDLLNKDLSAQVRSNWPEGSLIREVAETAFIGSADDQDQFELALGAGQRLSLAVDPADSLLAGVSIYRIAAGVETLVAAVQSPAAGRAAVVQTLSTGTSAAARYRVVVRGVSGTAGEYTLHMAVNAALEAEANDGARNDTRAAAQRIDTSFVSLQAVRGDTLDRPLVARGAALGILDGATNDYFSFTMAAGESTTLWVKSADGTPVDVSLEDPYGVLLAVARDGILEVDGAIDTFVAKVAGTYYAKVTGAAGTQYSLVVTRNTSFECGNNNAIGQATPISGKIVDGRRWAGGYMEVGESLYTANWLDGRLLELDRNTGTIVSELPAPRAFVRSNPFALNLSSGRNLLGYNAGVTDWGGNPQVVQIARDSGELRDDWWGPWGDYTALAQLNGDFYVGDMSLGIIRVLDGNTGAQKRWMWLPDWATTGLAADNQSNRLFAVSQTATLYEIDPQTGQVLRSAPTENMQTFQQGLALVGDELFVSETMYGLGNWVNVYDRDTFAWRRTMTISGISEDSMITGLAGDGMGDAQDFWAVNGRDNYTLIIESHTPAVEVGDAANTLDVMLRLYDSTGQLVASDDNSAADHRNARLSYKVPVGRGGAYYVEVVPSPLTPTPTRGEYVIDVRGDTSAAASLTATSFVPPEGTSGREMPDSITVEFSQDVLLTSLKAADLLIDGKASVGMTIVDGNTATFQLPQDVMQWPLAEGGNGHYYMLTRSARTWQAAENEARTISTTAHLASITTAAEQAFIQRKFLSGRNEGRILWIGMTDSALEGRWAWINRDSTIGGYANWQTGEPSNASPQLDYASINAFADQGSEGTWRAENGSAEYFGLVELTTLPANYRSWAEGSHTVRISASTIISIQNRPILLANSTLNLDYTAPRVLSSSIAQGEVLETSASGRDTSVTIRFNEPMDTSSLDVSDVTLRGSLRGATYTPAIAEFDATGTILALGWDDLPEDDYHLTLRSGEGRFQDRVGWWLDGEGRDSLPSGNGAEGGAFELDFAVDVTSAPFAGDMTPLPPKGAAIGQGSLANLLIGPGDEDRFTIDLAAGQSVTVLVRPAASLRPAIDVLDPSGNVVATAAAGEAGYEALLQSVRAVDAGAYTLLIRGADATTGTYGIDVQINASLEEEHRDLVPPVPVASSSLDYSAGFADPAGLAANGIASFVDGRARLTSGIAGLPGSVFTTTPFEVTGFNTSFTFQIRPGSAPMAEGFTFTIQNSDPGALGTVPGGLGYEGIPNSVAVKFDLWDDAGEGDNSTGLYIGGNRPVGEGSIDLSAAGIDLHSQHLFRADLSYNGALLLVRITDTGSGATAAQSYDVNIPHAVGGDTAYLGFTADTGWFSALHEIASWQFQTLRPSTNDAMETAQSLASAFGTMSNGTSRAAVRGATDGSGPFVATAIPFEFEDISLTGTRAIAGYADDVSVLVDGTAGGFSFRFFNSTYSNLYISSNGLISFGAAISTYINTDLSAAPAAPAIAPLWDDLRVSSGSGVYWQLAGEAGEQRLIVQWDKVYYPADANPITFQAILSERDGSVQFNYLDLASDDPTRSEAASATAGLKSGGTERVQRLLLAHDSGTNEFVGSGRSTRLSRADGKADLYSFTARAGDRMTLLLQSMSAANLTLDLLDPTGTLLAAGVDLGNGSDVARDIVVESDGTYYARIRGEIAGYTLLVDRDEATDPIADPEPAGTLSALFSSSPIAGAEEWL